MLVTERERIAELGERVFADSIARKLPPDSTGKLVVLDVDSKDFEVSSDDALLASIERLKQRHPKAKLYALRVGYKAVHTFGGVLPAA